MGDHPAGALQQWFDDNRSDLAASLRQQRLELLNAFDVARLALESHRTPVAVRRMHAMHGIPHRAKRFRKPRIVADARVSGRFPAVPMLHCDDLPLFRALLVAEM